MSADMSAHDPEANRSTPDWNHGEGTDHGERGEGERKERDNAQEDTAAV